MLDKWSDQVTEKTDIVCSHGYRNQLISSDNLDPHASGWTNDSLTNALQGYSGKHWVLRLDLGYLIDMSQGHLACLLVTFWNEVEEREGELVAIRGGGGGGRGTMMVKLVAIWLLLCSYLVSGLLLWCQQLLLESRRWEGRWWRRRTYDLTVWCVEETIVQHVRGEVGVLKGTWSVSTYWSVSGLHWLWSWQE